MKHSKTATAALVFVLAGVVSAQQLTQRQIRDPRKFGAIWNAASDTEGAKSGATVTAAERSGFINHTVLTLTDTPVIVVGASGVGFGGVKIYDWPEGAIQVLGVTVDSLIVTVGTGLDAADGGDWSFGTAIVSDADLTDATDVDLCPITSADPIAGTNSAQLAANAIFDGTTTAKDCNFNMIVDDADISGTVTNTIDATVTIHWINLGDY